MQYWTGNTHPDPQRIANQSDQRDGEPRSELNKLKDLLEKKFKKTLDHKTILPA
jgi:hypothetical protein